MQTSFFKFFFEEFFSKLIYQTMLCFDKFGVLNFLQWLTELEHKYRGIINENKLLLQEIY